MVELLVVVLIIGILAAMAMPHYEKAVWQSRNTQLKMAARNGTSTIEDGEFCEELESATYDTTAGGWARYIMP